MVEMVGIQAVMMGIEQVQVGFRLRIAGCLGKYRSCEV